MPPILGAASLHCVPHARGEADPRQSASEAARSTPERFRACRLRVRRTRRRGPDCSTTLESRTVPAAHPPTDRTWRDGPPPPAETCPCAAPPCRPLTPEHALVPGPAFQD